MPAASVEEQAKSKKGHEFVDGAHRKSRGNPGGDRRRGTENR